MLKLHRKILSITAMTAMTAAALLSAAGGLAAQSGGGEGEKPPAEQRERARAVPQVTGTVVLWNGNRIDLKTADGKTQKVAVNPETERLMEIEEGAEVTVEYRRKVGGFVIAERVRPAQEAAQAGTGTAPGPSPSTLTGTVVSWNNAALVLRTGEDEVTLYLSPTTEYLVESLDPGLLVLVEYREGSDRAKLATRVRAAGESRKEDGPAEGGRSQGSEPGG